VHTIRRCRAVSACAGGNWNRHTGCPVGAAASVEHTSTACLHENCVCSGDWRLGAWACATELVDAWLLHSTLRPGPVLTRAGPCTSGCGSCGGQEVRSLVFLQHCQHEFGHRALVQQACLRSLWGKFVSIDCKFQAVGSGMCEVSDAFMSTASQAHVQQLSKPITGENAVPFYAAMQSKGGSHNWWERRRPRLCTRPTSGAHSNSGNSCTHHSAHSRPSSLALCVRL
jgi:hypothetical protein